MRAFFAMTLFMISVLVFCAGIAAVTEYPSCYMRASKMGFEHSWGLFTGCMIKVPTYDEQGQWVDIENYKVIGE